MRQSIPLALVVLAFGFGFVSVANGQEGRPVGERPEASTRSTRPAEPESPATRGVPAQGNQAAAPRLVKVSGVLTEFVRNSVSSSVEMTFAVYKDEVGGEALWTETQSLEVDKEGRYTVLLGAAQADGVPVELFPAGEPRWLGVEIRGQASQPRTLLVSVPYALKALDADKLSGKSLSDFVLSESLGEQVRQVIQAQGQSAGQSTPAGAQQKQTGTSNATTPQTTSPGPKFPPSAFSGATTDQIVLVQQNGSGNGLYAQTASGTGNSGVVGVATSTSTSNNQNGVIGFNAGAGSGVAGIATNPSVGVGVYGQGASFAGVFGQTFVPSTSGVAGNANATTGFSPGVYGLSASTSGPGVFGNAVATSGFANGVQGQTASPDGAGVLGMNNATSGFAPGVSANSASPNGVGVFSITNATTGSASGVIGVTNSPGGAGVIGVTNAASPGANGVYGKSIGTGGNGVFGDATASSGFTRGVLGQTASPDGQGVFGFAYAASGFNIGTRGDSLSTEGIGVAGYADANSGPTNGVLGQSVSPNGNGVIGVSNVNAPPCNQNFCPEGVGVQGIANGTNGNAYGVSGATQTTGFGAGVAGAAFATTGTAFGVFGQEHSPNGSAVFGAADSTSGYPNAVVGFLDSPQGGVAGQFVAHTGAGLILQGLSGPNFSQVFSVDANGNLNISGNLVVSGTKSSTARLQNGREVALYAVESPENWFEDFGSAELKSGVTWVPLDASFAEATNAAVTYHVFLTPNGDSKGLYVARKTPTGFEVREQGGGSANIAFDYRIVARRRGFETVRMAEVQHDVKAADASRQHLAQFVTSGISKKAAAITPPRNIQAPVIRPAASRPSAPEVPKQAIPQPPKMSVPQLPRINVPQAPKGSFPQPSQPR